MMRKATDKWRAHGFDLEFSELGYEGDRNDVADYLDTLGWRSAGKPMSELLADHGLPPVPQAQRLGVDGRHDLLHLDQVTQTPQRRGFNDAVTRFWGVAAPAYNLPFLQQWVYRPAHDEVVAQLRDHKSARVADIACGTGILADRIERELHPAEVYGVDMSEGMLKAARSRSTQCSGCAARPSNCLSTTGRWTRSSRRRRFTSSTSPRRCANSIACCHRAGWSQCRHSVHANRCCRGRRPAGGHRRTIRRPPRCGDCSRTPDSPSTPSIGSGDHYGHVPSRT